MNDGLESFWTETVVAHFSISFQNSSCRTEENHENHHPRWPLPGLKSKDVTVMATGVSRIQNKLVGVEVITGMIMKSSIFWNITACSPLKVNRSFGEDIAFIFRVQE
jgi:hypothetical protein